MALSPLTPYELDPILPTIPRWRSVNDSLVRDYEFASHPEAIAFIVRVSEVAEEHEHHPEILNVWSKVTLTLRTHDAGDKVTSFDVQLARAIDDLDEG